MSIEKLEATSENLLENRKEEEETNNELIKQGVKTAIRYLNSQNYEIMDQNWDCPFGTVDIIAKDPNSTICFIEVSTRRGMKTGLPEESATKSKRARYEKIAMCYMMDTDIEDNTILRFDTIAICVADSFDRALLRHHKSWFCE